MDLCETHASRITAPKGWELVRYEGVSRPPYTRRGRSHRAGRSGPRGRPGGAPRTDDGSPESRSGASVPSAPPTVRTGRRGHLRVLPDPAN
ncbi:DUF3499 family protein [Rhodococcus hoagii]|nr:DUF3499 family protein [Prescottella equi]